MLDIVKSKKNLMFKVLLVEDIKVNQMVFIGMLNSFGFDVDVADNGEQGVEMWKPGKYDAVFMDIQMPVLNGLEAARRIRAAEKGEAHTVIIALTANAFSDDRKACMDVGMDAFLAKPIDITALKETLAVCLQSI